MDFEEKLSKFIEQIPIRKEVIKTEEATKTSLVLPFLRVLGYDFTNPLEVSPEYDADFGTKKHEKIDYAILKDGSPIIFMECKSVNADLDNKKCCSQLYRYFSVSNAKIGILTNGIEYRFYSDVKSKNKMDQVPFLSVNLEVLTSDHTEALKKFQKETFSSENIVNSAEDMLFQGEIRKALESELNNPSDAFQDILIKQVHHGRMTSKIREKYDPIIKNAIRMMISEKVTSRLKNAIESEKKTMPEPILVVEDNGIETTDEELFAFNIVRAICSAAVSPDRVTIRDAKSYCAVLLDDNNRKGICRFYFNSATTKHLATFDENGSEVKYRIENINDIYGYQNQIHETVERYLKNE
jgi:hypothetical protein